MADVRLLSPKTDRKPETIVILETDGLRERKQHETVHLKEDEDTLCDRCAVIPGVWTNEHRIWERHPMRCTAG